MDNDTECKTCDKTECSAKSEKADERLEDFLERQELAKTLCQIDHKILVLSGKGGVGKSTVAVNLAVALALDGKDVGLLDIDIHGPSIPKLLHLEGQGLVSDGKKMTPARCAPGLRVMSIGFLLRNLDDAVIWRGPLKMGVIKQFIKDVVWGKLDYLIVDSPPGTGDEPLSICQLIENADGAVIVTTPQDLSVIDVRKCIKFCSTLKMPVLGVIENMSGLICPHCDERIDVFKSGGGKKMAMDMGVPYLGDITMDPKLVAACDDGTPFVHHYADTETAKSFMRIVRRVQDGLKPSETLQAPATQVKENSRMKVAVPLAEGRLSMHFGHCEAFALFEVNQDEKIIVSSETVEAPAHEPGLLPRWLQERGVDLLIAGGMGMRAQGFFQEFGIDVIVGAPSEEPEKVVTDWLNGTLVAGANICDH